MTWEAPFVHQLQGPDGPTVRSILDDLRQFLLNPSFPNGLSVGDGVSTYNPATGVKSQVAMKEVPRGIIAQQVLTADGASLTASAATDMALNNVPVVKDHTYAIHLHSEVTFSDLGFAGDRWYLECRLNGVALDRLANLMPGLAGNTSITVDATVYWVAPTTQSTDDFTVFAVEQAGDANIQLRGAATARRTLTVIDLGVL